MVSITKDSTHPGQPLFELLPNRPKDSYYPWAVASITELPSLNTLYKRFNIQIFVRYRASQYLSEVMWSVYNHRETNMICSQVIHVAWIRHLLDVDPERPVVACVKLDDAMFNHVLQVGKTSPDVPLVLHRVCSGAGVPVPESSCYWLKRGQRKTHDTKRLKKQTGNMRSSQSISILSTVKIKHPQAKVPAATHKHVCCLYISG